MSQSETRPAKKLTGYATSLELAVWKSLFSRGRMLQRLLLKVSRDGNNRLLRAFNFKRRSEIIIRLQLLSRQKMKKGFNIFKKSDSNFTSPSIDSQQHKLA